MLLALAALKVQRGLVGRALDLKSGDPEFKSRYDPMTASWICSSSPFLLLGWAFT